MTTQVLRPRPSRGAWAIPVVLWALLACSALDIRGQTQAVDFGDAPDRPYPTTLGANGARHTISQGVFLGFRVDAEADGQQNSTATGDDIVPTTADDEDGVRFLTPLVPGQFAAVEVIASVSGRLDAWIDFEPNGTWVEQTDRIFGSRQLTVGTNVLAFAVPATAKVGPTFARFRFSLLGDLNSTGAASNGEVEDYAVDIVEQSLDFGDLPAVYATLLADNGARHNIIAGFHLGATVDAEPDGQPTATALGDDNPPPSGGPDDEDGVTFISGIIPGQPAQIEVVASATGRLDAWVDFNGNGSFLDTGEQVFTSQVLVTGVNPLSFNVPTAAVPRDTYARFRFSQQGGLRPEGPAPAGEVEDYRIVIEQDKLDYGDAPQGYPVLLGNNGARHQPSELRLGAFIDLESNGQPSADALGDDNTAGAPDDEDGVRFLTPLIPGQSAQVEVTVNLPCQLDAWIDFNLNGSWAEANERIFSVESLVPGANVLTFTVPAGAATRDTFARFRVSEKGGLSFAGFAPDGEVEDYRIDVQDRPLDFGDAPQNYPVVLTQNGARHIIVPGFHLGEREDAEPDGQPSADALGDDGPAGAPDDEDGVRFMTPLIPGQSAQVEVTASEKGVLNAWVDFNINGSWADDLEQIFVDVPIPAGATTLSFSVPSSALPRATFARFRFSSEGKISYDGFAPDGEVEDYRVEQGRPLDCDQNCTGTNFWLTFPGNYAPDTNNPVQLSLCILGAPGTACEVRIPGLGFSLPFNIPGGGVALIPLPRAADLGDANDVITKKGILVRASGPIRVEGLNHVRYTTDGFAGIPTSVLGNEYIVSSFGNVHTGAPDLNGTQFAIVATEDETRVFITPRMAVAGHAANVPYLVVLQAGETYQLRATNDAPADLTGTVIESDKPVAVFGSHQCANVPSSNEWFCDYIVEQLLPTKNWGRGFLTAPLATRAGDTFRILASADNTDVRIGTQIVATLDRGEFYQVTMATGAVILATEPVSVMQHANSSDFDLVTDSDPFMVIVPPVNLYNTDHTVCTAPLDFTAHYVNIITPNAAIGALTLNGVVVPAAAFTPIAGVPFSFAQRPVGVGVHRVSSPQPVSVAIYGWAEYDSYGYPGCLAYGDSTPPTLTCLVTNISVTLGSGSTVNSCFTTVPDLRSQVRYSDNCGLSENTVPRQVPAPGTVVGAGIHPIRISVTDLNGNTAFCIITLTVTDPSPPTIQCPSNILARCTSTNGARVQYSVTARTQCISNLTSVVCTPPPGSVFPIGTTTVTCIASNSGQFATCTFTVTVKCPEVSINLSNNVAVLTWDSGTLESAPTVIGPWGTEQNARSPYLVPTVAPKRFFRIRADE